MVTARKTARAPEASLPTFIHRCRHRRASVTAPSEKLGKVVCWTTSRQGDLADVLEVAHNVVSYMPWPGPVTLQNEWGDLFDYWPAMSVGLATGAITYIDVRHRQDAEERAAFGFDLLLEEALKRKDIRLLVLGDAAVAADANLRVARQVRHFTGTSARHGRDDRDRLMGLLRDHGGSLTLGEIRSSGPAGHDMLAMACVQVMRRRLRLVARPGGFDASVASLVPGTVSP